MRDSLGRALAGLARELAHAALQARDQPTDTTHFPPISVVICTRDRPQLLERCLESLTRLDYPQMEVVIVDNAPTTDATAQLAARFPFRHVTEPIAGLDWARNRGIAEARHDIIGFTDDDVRVDRLWLRSIAAAFSDARVGLVTGFVAPGSLETEAERIFELSYGGMGKGFRARTFDPSTMSSRELLGTQHLGVGANMAARRGVLHQLGGFDTALDVGTPAHGGGDLDMFHRVLRAGWSVRYDPGAIVWHHHRTSEADLRRQMYDNGRAFGTYLLKRFRDGRVPRGETAFHAGRWKWWLFARIVRRFLRRERMPMPYLLAEVWGALHAPYAFVRSYARDRRVRRRHAGSARAAPK